MSELIRNSTPAQRARGQSFGERFISAARVVSNGGTVYGTPTIDFGATFNGTTDYIKYQLQGTEFCCDEISILIEFYPDDNYDVDKNIVLFGSGISYKVEKRLNVNNNALQIYLGGLLISAISEGVYGQHWKQGEFNQLVIYGTSGNTSVDLNNNTILSGDSSPWSSVAIDELAVGATELGTKNFDGRITSFEIYKDVLTKSEISDFYNNSTYNYRNKAVLDLPMRAAQHEATRTLDVSGNGNHAVFGAGAAPDKLTKRGYNFDGTDYAKLEDNLSSFDELSLSMEVMPKTISTPIYIFFNSNSSLGFSWGMRITIGGAYQVVHNSGGAIWSPGLLASTGIVNRITLSIDSANNAKFYANGSYISGSSLTIPDRAGEFYLSRSASPFFGNMYHFLANDFELTPIQVADLHGKMMRSINAV